MFLTELPEKYGFFWLQSCFSIVKKAADRMITRKAYIGVRPTNDGGFEMNQTKKTNVARKKKGYPSNGVETHDIILATAFITNKQK